MDYGNLIVSVLIPLVSVLGSVLYIRRSKKAEVKSKEADAKAKEIENEKSDISTAQAMIDLVEKAHEKASELQQEMIAELKAEIASNAEYKLEQQKFVKTLKSENEKFKKNVSRLERAFGVISLCDHRDGCPVYTELQGLRGSNGDENGETGSKG